MLLWSEGNVRLSLSQTHTSNPVSQTACAGIYLSDGENNYVHGEQSPKSKLIGTEGMSRLGDAPDIENLQPVHGLQLWTFVTFASCWKITELPCQKSNQNA